MTNIDFLEQQVAELEIEIWASLKTIEEMKIERDQLLDAASVLDSAINGIEEDIDFLEQDMQQLQQEIDAELDSEEENNS